jgi:3-oxoacyl-[acyl-carrier protein] reductase
MSTALPTGNLLSGQVALVTGGSRGIGAAISKALANQGAKVAVNYARNAEKADEVVQSLLAQDCQAQAYGFDVSSEEQVTEGIKKITQDLGAPTILVNNAGIADDGLLVRTKADAWQKTIEVNLSSCFYCSKAVAKGMMKARAGRIVNISSVIGETGNAGQAAYAASKAGIFGLTKSLAKELGSRGVTVNSVTPGYIDTEMTAYFSDEQRAAMIEQIPLGRLGGVEDIAQTVVFLCSPGASYITGQILGVNGGMYM